MNVAQLLMQKQQQDASAQSAAQMHPDQLAAFQKQFFSMQQFMAQMAGSNATALPNEMLLSQLLPKFAMDSMPKLESSEQSPSANTNSKVFGAFDIDSLTANQPKNKRDSSNSDIDTLPEDEPHSPNGKNSSFLQLILF
jgi:hypothetical protein